MAGDADLLGDAFKVFMEEAPDFANAWIGGARALAEASALDDKVRELAYIGILAASGNIPGIPFHVANAKAAGATRDEVKSAVLLGITAVGGQVIQALPVTLSAYDDASD